MLLRRMRRDCVTQGMLRFFVARVILGPTSWRSYRRRAMSKERGGDAHTPASLSGRAMIDGQTIHVMIWPRRWKLRFVAKEASAIQQGSGTDSGCTFAA